MQAKGTDPRPIALRGFGTLLPILLGVVFVGVQAQGCAPSGEDPGSRLSVYSPPSDEYRVRYLEPPWELSQTEGTRAQLRIISSGERFGNQDGGLGNFELSVTVEVGDPAVRVLTDLDRARGAGDTVLAGPVAVTAGVLEGRPVQGGELSLQTTALTGPRHRRIAYFPLEGGRVLRLAFDASPPLDTPEVDAMIANLGVGSTP